jgi:hypothetical protein
METKRITAAEARLLSGPSAQERVDQVYPLIRGAAEQRRRSVHLTDVFWTQGGYQGTAEWAAACEVLRADGFTVSFFYEERQFVNMYTVVEW